ncbi:hypothetical protein C0995_006710 [Termitomyces sp. Mi166|nr:hypothetical protein C0995_006710 [Termitomyces sp. Mi166\
MPDKRPRGCINSDIDHLSDDEILNLTIDAPKLVPPAENFFESDVCQLTPTTVAKECQDMGFDSADAAEANALNLVYAETTIPVPRVRRLIPVDDSFLIVMDYIPGQTLAKAWPTLSTWQKIRTAFTLRRYIRQLRRLKGSATTPPGPLSVEGPRVCHSPMFGTLRPARGPFSSYSELSKFFNERHQLAAKIAGTPQDVPQRNECFDDFEPLVLTHQDLNLRNIIVGKDGRLWIIDWAWAGYYPVWFEYTTMQIQNEVECISGTTDPFWRALIPFICGPYFRQERWWKWMSASLYGR